jgi:hypothetical protein
VSLIAYHGFNGLEFVEYHKFDSNQRVVRRPQLVYVIVELTWSQIQHFKAIRIGYVASFMLVVLSMPRKLVNPFVWFDHEYSRAKDSTSVEMLFLLGRIVDYQGLVRIQTKAFLHVYLKILLCVKKF